MVAPSIKNDLGKLLVDQAMTTLDNWALRELTHLRNTADFPICVALSNKSWAVGKYTMHQLGSHQWSVVQDSRTVHVFYSKQAAVFYSVFNQCNRFKSADDLLESDQAVAKHNDEVEFYTLRLAKQTKKTDEFTQQLRWIRYLDAKAKLKTAREELDKKLNYAKYNKIWASGLKL
jgi:hypothetical protein